MRRMTRGNYRTDMIHVCVLANLFDLRCGAGALRANVRCFLTIRYALWRNRHHFAGF
jgi:hypothetical protein